MNTKGLKVKANIKKHFVCGGVILLCYVYLFTHEISDAEIYGFWAGLWQGGIFLPKFIISLFLDNVKFIAKNRTLGYDIAFFFVNIVSLFYFVAVIIKSRREKHQSFSLLDLMMLCLIIHTLPTFLEIFQRKISVVQVEVLCYFYSKQKYYV